MYNVSIHTPEIIETTIAGIKGIYNRVSNTIKDIVDHQIPKMYMMLFRTESRQQFDSFIGMFIMFIISLTLVQMALATTYLSAGLIFITGFIALMVTSIAMVLFISYVNDTVEQRWAFCNA
jgi:hypothetical protein